MRRAVEIVVAVLLLVFVWRDAMWGFIAWYSGVEYDDSAAAVAWILAHLLVLLAAAGLLLRPARRVP